MKVEIYAKIRVILSLVLTIFIVNIGYSQIIISSNTTWSTTRSINDVVTVKPGATLTITSPYVYFDEYNGRIIVERGGHLVLNNTVLTSAVSSRYWLGIEVWGNPGLNQSNANQGRITINNSLIENSIIGVCVSKLASLDPTCMPDPYIIGCDENYSGGKIVAENTVFRNNKNSVTFSEYGYTNSSSFKSCKFEFTRTDFNPYRLVALYQVRGVSFSGCTFRLGTPIYNQTADQRNTTGILAYNSSFTVSNLCGGILCAHGYDGLCADPPLSNYSKFENLQYGIWTVSYAGSPTFTVRRTNFECNERGIYCSSMNNISVKDCNFNVPTIWNTNSKNLTSEPTDSYGIYLNGSTGYQIEGNVFNGYVTAPPFGEVHQQFHAVGTYGMVVYNSGTAANKIYNNDFNKLAIAVQAQGKNRNPDNSTGLCITCNDFTANHTDINVVTQDLHSPSTANLFGIATHQRNGTKPACNTFSQNSSNPFQTWHILNEAYPIYYYMYSYAPANHRATKTKGVQPMNVTGIPNPATDCPRTTITIDPGVLNSYAGNINNITNEMSAKVDGGNSEELILTIGRSTGNDSNELRGLLLDNSPYLSNDAIKSVAANEEAVNNITLRDVMIGNSHAITDNEIMETIDNRTTPLPGYMYDQIDQAAKNVSGKMQLEIELQNEKAAYTVAFATLANQSITNDDITEWEELMNGAIELDDKYSYAVYSATMGNTAKSDAVMAEIAAMIGNDAELISQHEDYTLYLALVKSDAIKNLTLENTTTIDELFYLSEKSNNVSQLAINVLNRIGAIDYSEPIFNNDDFKSNVAQTSRKRVTLEDVSDINIYPNPAKDYAYIEYNAKGLNNIEMSITDINGNTVYSNKLVDSQNGIHVDLKGWKSGVYTVNITGEGNKIIGKKIIIK